MQFLDNHNVSDIADRIDKYVDSIHIKQQFSGSVLFAYRGNVLLRRAYGMADYENRIPATPKTRYRLCSISKQFTALAILQLQKHKLVDLKKPIAHYLPHHDCDARITIEHLLMHSDGIPNYTSSDEFKNIYRNNSLMISEVIDLYKYKLLNFTPGRQFSYGNSGYVLLAALIEQISGQSYAAYLNKNILEPLDMYDTGCDRKEFVIDNLARGYLYIDDRLTRAPKMAMETVVGAGDIFGTIDDLYRWNCAGFSSKTFEPSLFTRMQKRYIKASNFFDNPSYGYGLFIASILGEKTIGHFGRLSGFHTLFLHFEQDTCLIMLSNIEQSPIEEMAEHMLSTLME